MSEVNYYVYTHSKPDGTIFYVGKGTEARLKKISRKSNPHHTNIVNKYGKENIIVRSMLCRNEQHALELEIKMIAALRNGGVKLVNMTDGGEGASGYIHTDEAKQKISLAKRNLSEETRSKISSILRNRSSEVKLKIAASLTGRTPSEETKAKISASKKGILKTDETKAKMSMAQRGRILSDEHKAKISAVQKGRRHTDESKAKMSESAKNRKSTTQEGEVK